jgi:hypothetical protein
VSGTVRAGGILLRELEGVLDADVEARRRRVRDRRRSRRQRQDSRYEGDGAGHHLHDNPAAARVMRLLAAESQAGAASAAA